MQGWWACHLSFEINSVRVLNTGTFILIFVSQAFIKSGSYIHTYVCVLTEQMDMDKSTRLEILIENIHTLWDLPRLIKSSGYTNLTNFRPFIDSWGYPLN